MSAADRELAANDPAEILRRIRAELRDRVVGDDPEAALTAALGTAWSPALTGSADLGAIADVLLDAGLAEGDTGTRWWVPETAGRQITDWALGAAGADPQGTIGRALQRIASAVEGAVARITDPAGVDDPDTPPTMARLARIIADDSRDEKAIGENLVRLVQTTDDESDALNYINAAGRLGAVSDTVEAARMRAARILDARSDEERRRAFLDTYFRRPELHEQLRAFVAGDDPEGSDVWATHLKGGGGVGKTMLLRGLAAEFPADGSAGSIAVVDFDHLDPDYPGRKPALLLSALAATLERFGGSAIERARQSFDVIAHDWNIRVTQSIVSDAGLLPELQAERMGPVHGAFARYLDALPQPVVLVLDTCEELDKHSTPADDHVGALFASLEAIHNWLPQVRVVLAGRRPLAAGGAGWTERSPAGGRPVRSYLGRIEVHPFTFPEAGAFARFRGVDDELVRQVVARAAAGSTFVNPFDLDLVCHWAVDAEPGDDVLTVDVDRFLEQRVLSRISEPRVRDAVPAVVLLGTFDIDALGAVTGTTGEALSNLSLAIGAQEWVTTGVDGLQSVDVNLVERLTAYYQHRQPARWADLWQRAANHFAPVVERADEQLTSTPTHQVVAALRFSADPPASWQRIEQAAAEAGAFAWLEDTTRTVRREVDEDSPLYWSLGATAASLLQLGRPTVYDWTEIAAASEPGSGPWLRAKAHLCDLHALDAWWEGVGQPTVSDDVAAALVAGLDRALAGGRDADLDEHASWVARVLLASDSPPPLLLAAVVLLARALLAVGLVDTAENIREMVLDLAGRRGIGGGWLDWHRSWAPAWARAWIAADWWPRYVDPNTARRWLLPEAGFTDPDRAAEWSLATLMEVAGSDPVTLPDLAIAASVPVATGLDARVPPPAAAVALALAFQGEVGRAMDVIDGLGSGLDRTTAGAGVALQSIERARLALVRRFRLHDVGRALQSTLSSSTHLVDLELLGVLDTLDGPKAGLPAPFRVLEFGLRSSPAERHVAWRCTRADDVAALGIALAWPTAAVPNSRDIRSWDAVGVHDLLDDVERRRVRGETANVPLTAIVAWVADEPRHPVDVALIGLRVMALTGGTGVVPEFQGATERLGARAAAELALEEGELLAHRLPGEAALLLDWVEQAFERAHDVFGRLRARAASATLDRRRGRPVDPDRTFAVLAAASLPGFEPADLVHDGAGVVRRFDLPELRPLLGRLAWAVQTPGSPEDRELRVVLEELFGSPGPDGQVLLAADFDLAAAAEREVPTDGPRPRVLSLRAEKRGVNAWLLRGLATVVVEADDGARSTIHVPAFDEPPFGSWWGDRLRVRKPRGSDSGELAELVGAVRPGQAVLLHHDLELSGIAWERFVPSVVAGSTSRRVYRSTRGAAARRGPRSVQVISGVRAANSQSFALWESLDVTLVSTGGPFIPVESGAGNLGHIVHAITEVVETADGLELVQDRASKVLRTLRPSELLAARPDVVVLQGPPAGPDSTVVSGAERATYFRHLGGELSLGGTPVVIVLPASQVPDAARPLHRLATADELTERLVQAVTVELRANHPEPSDVVVYLGDTLT